MSNQEVYTQFLNKFFSDSLYKVHSLAGDASNRRYYRVIRENQSWVLMCWEPFVPLNYPFLSVLEHFLKNNVHVPEVVAMSPQEGLVLLEDLGDLTLERKFWESHLPESSVDFYKKALDEIIKIHFVATADKSDCTAFKIMFDVEKFLWEMNYGREHLIEGICKFSFNDSIKSEVQKVFTDICTRLHNEPKFIAHRDYHSRNLMIKLDQMRVIDFQDARLGPIQYDLVSLLRDSYVNIPDNMASTLLNYYLEQSREYLWDGFSKEHFDLVYELQTIQRCFKACGSFSSFYMLRKDTRYLKYISGTLKRIIKSLNMFPEYKAFSDVLIDSGALEKKYEAL